MTHPPQPRWEHIKDIFSEAITLPPLSRDAWLVQACGDDAELRSRIEALLHSHDRAGDFLAAPAFANPGAAQAIVDATNSDSTAHAAPDRCGEYRIEREIGRGGMGVVYLATRDDNRFEKAVAIKIVSAIGAHPLLLQRFDDERRILAALDHPNIARLIDAGTTSAGVPFVVMEFVEGEPIDAYCSRTALPVRDRLRLFGLVCDAVQYSHQHLVVHRDIKAGNILVTPGGVPKLLDFGIATLLQPDTPERLDGQATHTAFRALTPESASPEQIRGERSTVSTDVYSLGVLLYRLLTDRGPYRGEMKTDADVVRAICEDSPVRPSDAVAADKKRRGELQGDLDVIVLKALQKDRTRRYSTVEQLSDDVARHLGGRPVLARPDSVRYRAAKFAARHRFGTIASLMAALLLVAGVITTAWQARVASIQRARAERRFNDVRRLATSFLFEFNDAIETLPGATKARELLVLRATEYLNSLASDSTTDAALQRELAASYEKVGDVQGLPGFSNLGDTAGALQSHRTALALRESLAAASSMDVVAQRELATTYHHLSAIKSQMGDAQAALDYERKSIEVRERLRAGNPSGRAEQRSVAIGYQRLGEIMADLQDWPAATESLHRQATTFEALLASNPSDPGPQRDAALAFKKLGAMLERNGEWAGSLVNYRKALGLDEARARASVNDLQPSLDLSYSYASIGHLLATTGDVAGALDNYARALACREQVAAADPHDANARAAVGRAHVGISNVLRDAGRSAEALPHLRNAVAISAGLYASDPNITAVGERLANVYLQLASANVAVAEATATTGAEARRRWVEVRESAESGIKVLAGYRADGVLSAAGDADLNALTGVLTRARSR